MQGMRLGWVSRAAIVITKRCALILFVWREREWIEGPGLCEEWREPRWRRLAWPRDAGRGHISRVDATRSKVQLLRPDSTVTDLPLEKQTAPDTLTTKATGLTPGEYKIQWQVLSPDGHITRGILPFVVKAA